LTLLEQNYHSRFGEIDLIMRDPNTLVFIEVRQRSSNDLATHSQALISANSKRSFLLRNITSLHTLTIAHAVLTLSL
jgi:Holliday junction resolvase-like predicted endonuclease